MEDAICFLRLFSANSSSMVGLGGAPEGRRGVLILIGEGGRGGGGGTGGGLRVGVVVRA